LYQCCNTAVESCQGYRVRPKLLNPREHLRYLFIGNASRKLFDLLTILLSENFRRQLHSVTISDAVTEAYYTYHDAVMGIVAQGGLEELDSWHNRLSVKALRVAMLLASFDNDNMVELRHWARAQTIAERWRGSLHRLYQQTNAQTEVSAEATAEDAVYDVIRRLGAPSVRDIKTRIATMSAGEIKERADKLVKAGLIDAVPTGRTLRYLLATTEGTEETVSSAVYGIPMRQSGEVKN
jgi:hypothetical protein